MEKSLQNKIFAITSQSELGRQLGKRPQTISVWFKKRVPAEWVVSMSKALGWKVTPHELRPDKYPNPTDALPPHKEYVA
ncbi:transcriptional regulator [Sodalis sp. (in: enterobacteria)]|uniref:transcriptional regulator n=1 Tax=Sodalis sp. (in: enterobacteria) TaxID=1898979 RepID=UPI003F3A6441